MKKRFFVLIASALLLVSLCSCGNKKDKENVSEEQQKHATYENVLSSEHNDMFLYKNFDEKFIDTFVEEYFKKHNVPLDNKLEGALFKVIVINDSVSASPDSTRAAVESVLNSVLKENPTSYRLKYEPLESAVRIRVHYSFESEIKAEDLFE